MKHLTALAATCAAVASFASLATVQAEPVIHASRVASQTAQGGLAVRSAGAINGSNVDAFGQRRLFSDGQGNLNASSTATNANTGVTYDGSTTYTKGSGISRSAGCTDAAGNAVTCGSARR